MEKLKKNKKQELILTSVFFILLFILVITIVFKVLSGKVLKSDNKTVTEIYNYFDLDVLDNCNGLVNYANEKVQYKDIDSEIKNCIAYHKTSINEEYKETIKKEKKKDICQIDDMVFRVDDNSSECTINKIPKSIINTTYKKIFGKDIDSEDSFKYDNNHICYLKNDYYYCGLSETFTYTIGSDSTIYRVIQKAIEKSGTIEIYDYFIRVNNEICYKDYSFNAENKKCSEKYDENKIDYNFLKKYGTRYKHKYKKLGENYYWESTEPMDY